MSDDYLNVDGSIEDANPTFAAGFLESIAQTLHDSPEDARYDVSVEVDEQ